MRIKSQQYWAIIITLLFHTVLFWGLFFSEIKKNQKDKVYEIELSEEKIPTEKQEKEIEKLQEIADKQLQEMMSNKAAKRFVPGEKISQSGVSQLEQEFQQRKETADALKRAENEPREIQMQNLEKQMLEQDTTKHQTVFYVGDSRVEYFLAERYRVKLPIPIYKCEGAGKVEVAIWVNQQGVVINAEVVKERSHSASDCMKNAALNAALTSAFSERPVAPASQKGRIVYQFAAQ